MLKLEIDASRDVSDRRMNYLVSRGENTRNTIAWRDAVDERNEIERRAAFAAWCAAGCPVYRGRITK